MEQAVVYSNGGQECERLLSLLDSLGTKYILLTEDEHFTAKQFIPEFGEDAQYPQFAYGYSHIGGLKEALHFFKIQGSI